MRKRPPRILLLGYGGANNTGAEIRILTIIDDLRSVFGRAVPITLATMNPDKTRRVLPDDSGIHIAHLPYVFPATVWKLTREHDLVLLVEGSTFKDNWSSALLYLFLWGAWSAKRHGRYCIAYAVDAGRMSTLNQMLSRFVCERLDLLILRTAEARLQLRQIGVMRDIQVTTDTAFQFTTAALPRGKDMVVGLAPVELNQWPVRARLLGPRAECYHWPYYYTWTPERRARSAALVQAWAGLIRHIVEDRGWSVKLVAMEELDTDICRRILAQLAPAIRARVQPCYAGTERPQTIVAELRNLDYLVTSRYHACVLSMAAAVPQMALYHDERLGAIYRELGLQRHALAHDSPGLAARLHSGFAALVADADQVRAVLRRKLHGDYLPRCLANREALAEWARQHLGVTRGDPSQTPATEVEIDAAAG